MKNNTRRFGWLFSWALGLAMMLAVAIPQPAQADSQGYYLKCTVGSYTYLMDEGERLSNCTNGVSSGMIQVWYAGKYMRSIWWSPSRGTTVTFDRAKELQRLGYCIVGSAAGYLWFKAPGWGAGVETLAKLVTRASTLGTMKKCIAP